MLCSVQDGPWLTTALFNEHSKLWLVPNEETYSRSLNLWLSEYPCCHVIEIWALGNQYTFMTVTASCGHVIDIFLHFTVGFQQAKSREASSQTASCSHIMSHLMTVGDLVNKNGVSWYSHMVFYLRPCCLAKQFVVIKCGLPVVTGKNCSDTVCWDYFFRLGQQRET